MPVVKTTSPAWERGLPKDQPEYSEPSSSTSFACLCRFAMTKSYPGPEKTARPQKLRRVLLYFSVFCPTGGEKSAGSGIFLS
jgi:hypothetical protein